MDTTYDELKEMNSRINADNMAAMNESDFEKYFALLQGILNNGLRLARERPTASSGHSYHSGNAENVVRIAHSMLESSLRHHSQPGVYATDKAISLFQKIVEILLQLIWHDFQVDERVYEDSNKKRFFLKALQACGIHDPSPPYRSPSNRWDAEENWKKELAEGLEYGKAHIEEFCRFTFNMGTGGENSQNPFLSGHLTKGLALFELVKPLDATQMRINSSNSLPA